MKRNDDNDGTPGRLPEKPELILKEILQLKLLPLPKPLQLLRDDKPLTFRLIPSKETERLTIVWWTNQPVLQFLSPMDGDTLEEYLTSTLDRLNNTLLLSLLQPIISDTEDTLGSDPEL
jgi:hypothetical protein